MNKRKILRGLVKQKLKWAKRAQGLVNNERMRWENSPTRPTRVRPNTARNIAEAQDMAEFFHNLAAEGIAILRGAQPIEIKSHTEKTNE